MFWLNSMDNLLSLNCDSWFHPSPPIDFLLIFHRISRIPCYSMLGKLTQTKGIDYSQKPYPLYCESAPLLVFFLFPNKLWALSLPKRLFSWRWYSKNDSFCRKKAANAPSIASLRLYFVALLTERGSSIFAMTSFKQRTIPSKLRLFTSISPPTKQTQAFLLIHRLLNRDILLSLFIPFEFGIADIRTYALTKVFLCVSRKICI